MNVEIGTEAAQFSEKEYINGIFVAGRLVEKEAIHTEGREKCPFELGAKCTLRGCQLPEEAGTHSCIERRAMQALKRNVVLWEGHAALHKDSTPQTWNPAL